MSGIGPVDGSWAISRKGPAARKACRPRKAVGFSGSPSTPAVVCTMRNIPAFPLTL